MPVPVLRSHTPQRRPRTPQLKLKPGPVFVASGGGPRENNSQAPSWVCMLAPHSLSRLCRTMAFSSPAVIAEDVRLPRSGRGARGIGGAPAAASRAGADDDDDDDDDACLRSALSTSRRAAALAALTAAARSAWAAAMSATHSLASAGAEASRVQRPTRKRLGRLWSITATGRASSGARKRQCVASALGGFFGSCHAHRS